MGSEVTYFVTGLPRSRTTWFSAYLDCDHDLTAQYGPDAFHSRLGKGLSDSGLVFADFEGPTVVIHRPLADVIRSLRQQQIFPPVPLLEWAANQLSRMDGLHVDFHDIDVRLREITEYVGEPWDEARAERFKRMRIMPTEIRHTDTAQEWLCQRFGER